MEIVENKLEPHILEIKPTDDEDIKTTPLVFVHGAWHGKWCWSKVMKKLGKLGYQCIAFDLPGHGENNIQKSIKWLSLKSYLQELRDVIDQYVKTKPVLIGHSLGGAILFKHMKKFENEVQAYVLLSPAEWRGVLKLFGRLALSDWRFYLGIFTANLGRLVQTKDQVRKYLFTEDTPKHVVENCHENLQEESFLGANQLLFVRAKKPKKPTVIISGEQDWIFKNKNLSKLADKLEVQFEEIPDTGHDLMLEIKHDLLVNNIDNWLASIYMEN